MFNKNKTDLNLKTEESSHFRDVLSHLSPNHGAEMLRYGQSKAGVISLAQGEGSLPTPDFIIEAAHKALLEDKTFYAPVAGLPALRDEIARYYGDIYGVQIPANRVVVTSSGTTAIHLSMAAILEAGDEVVAITPIWKNLLGAIELTGSKTVQVPLDYKDGNGWDIDLEKLFAAVTSKTKAFLIVTPSNPTGWVMQERDIKAVQDFARERGIWIIADEVYARLSFTQKRTPSFIDHALPDDRLFVAYSFSKAYAMTGWRLGWLVCPAFAEGVVRDLAMYNNMGPPTFAQFGAMAALRDGEDFIEKQRGLFTRNLDLVMDRFAKIGRIEMPRPPATFYAFFRVEGEPDCLGFTKKLIDEGGLSLAPGCSFGKCCAGWMRLCFAVSEEKLNDALGRLERVIKTH